MELSQKDRVDMEKRLQCLMSDNSVPDYMRLIIEIMVDTKRELMEMNRKTTAILEENAILRQENLVLKQKVDDLLGTKFPESTISSNSNLSNNIPK